MSVDGVTDIADDSDNDYDEDEEFEEGGKGCIVYDCMIVW